MATVARKRKTVLKELEIPPPPKAAPLWLQSVAVFVAGLGLGVMLLGPGARWASELLDGRTLQAGTTASAGLPPPAFGGLPAGSSGALASVSSSVAAAPAPLVASSLAASSRQAAASSASAFAPLLRSRMDFVSVARGVTGGQDDAGYLVALTRPQLDKLWGDMTVRGVTLPSAAGVNLDGRMVVAVFAGKRPDASYAIEVSHVVLTESDVRIFVLETHAGPNCVQRFTPVTPFHVVTLDRVDLPLTVVREQAVVDCRQ